MTPPPDLAAAYDTYPTGPRELPADLSKPSAAYRRHAWLAVLGMLAFAALYCALSAWFAYTSVTMFMWAEEGFHLIIGGIFSGFFALFMLKGLFFFKRDADEFTPLEVTASDQGRLFDFLHRLADEAGAPRPHKVFLTPGVNAAVSNDLSLLNLLFSSKKNLYIGLGLVNVLSLGEFKAVCAHEFGHFAQRSMAVGRWVYIARQIVGQIVAKRDKFDEFINSLSHSDLRFAWLGWMLGLVVWALRAMLDTAFTLVMMAERALSREMEMQADLVAVSLTGSDAPINALYRLRAADEAWERSIGYVNEALINKRYPEDIYALQTRIISHLQVLLDDPGYGKSPAIPAENAAAFRAFQAEIAQPPKMWATHPFNHEREENAKRTYVAAPVDMRSAWDLFEQPEQLRQSVTQTLIGKIEAEPCASEETLERIDRDFERPHLSRSYRGAYLGRPLTRHVKNPAELYEGADGAIDQSKLYPADLADDLRKLDNLCKERDLLRSLESGHFVAPGKLIMYRGQALRKRELTKAITATDQDIRTLEEKLQAHDKEVRGVHLAMARTLGLGWEEYLTALIKFIHFAEHNQANIEDARRCLANRIAIATATRRVSDHDRSRVLSAAADLHQSMDSVFRGSPSVLLNETLKHALGRYGLAAPYVEGLGEWIDLCDGWVRHVCMRLNKLKAAALDELLLSEAKIAQWHAEQSSDVPHAPEIPTLGEGYPRLLPGQERTLQTTLGLWARFLAADGFLAGTARLLVAGGIVGAVFLITDFTGRTTLVVYNSLGRTVKIDACGQTIVLPADSNTEEHISFDKSCVIRTETLEGNEVERFQPDFAHSSTHIYNVAAAAPTYEWFATYGNATPVEPRTPAAVRWGYSKANILFSDPPQSVYTKGGGEVVSVLSHAPASANPSNLVDMLKDPKQQMQMIEMHARWDEGSSLYIAHWLHLATKAGIMERIIQQRLADNPHDITIMRYEQDLATQPDERTRVCARHQALAAKAPNDGDLAYLSARCIQDKDARNQATLELQRKFPLNAWVTNAAGYVQAGQGNWHEALDAWQKIPAKEHSLVNYASLEAARVQRLLEGTPKLDKLKSQSPTLTQILNLESGAGFDGEPAQAFSLMNQGNLQTAWARAEGTALEPVMKRLLIASEHKMGGPTWPLPKPDDMSGINSTTIWAAFAVAYREHQDTSKLLSHFDSTEQANLAQAFLTAARRGDQAAAEKLLRNIDPDVRGQMYCMATIVLGKNTPKAWRKGAKRLLFANERPYFD